MRAPRAVLQDLDRTLIDLRFFINYEAALHDVRLLGVEPTSAVMIGDSTWDAQAAIATGALALLGPKG